VSKNNPEIITLKQDGITDFAQERNKLLEKSKAEWVMFVDSDEVVSSELKDEIDQIAPEKYNGYYVYRKNYFLGKYVGTDKILRLGKRVTGKWTRAVHETWQIKGAIGYLKNPLIHNTANSLHDYIDKINFYSALHAKANLKEGKRSTIIKIIVFPAIKFFESMIIGRGFVMSILQSFHSFLGWSKLWILQRN